MKFQIDWFFIVEIIIGNGKKEKKKLPNTTSLSQVLSTITAKVMTCQPRCLKTVPVHTTVGRTTFLGYGNKRVLLDS